MDSTYRLGVQPQRLPHTSSKMFVSIPKQHLHLTNPKAIHLFSGLRASQGQNVGQLGGSLTQAVYLCVLVLSKNAVSYQQHDRVIDTLLGQ